MSQLERLIREALNQGDLDDCKDELLSHRAEVISHLAATYPRVDREVLETVWDSGLEHLLDLVEEDVANDN